MRAAVAAALVLSLCSQRALAAPVTNAPTRALDARHVGRATSDAPEGARSEGATGPARAPSGPPLTTPTYGASTGGPEAEAGASTEGERDPLVSNGLGSPLCQGALPGEELSRATRANCETSGFVAAPAPTGSYGIDVHIDTGFLGLSTGELLSVVQDLFVTPVWMALVWAVHALIVMLEWSFTIELLNNRATNVGAGLREMEANLTAPWLAAVLAAASVLAAYNGLIRRRVSDTLGQVSLAGAMMIGGLWVALDPTGTVGALGDWANEASLGTLAVSARGSPSGAGHALADSMAALFASTVEAPWCYLEFGDVGWCRSPARLDPRLHAAGLQIAARELAQATCSNSATPPCPPAGGAAAKALEHSAQLLRSARSNGAIFLALPANGPERNSINDERSLLRVMCQSSQATSCHGEMAAEAEFRTGGGTWKRVGGLLLIIAGALGMLLLFGFIALRLLGAAIFALLYLLLAPAAVLAPALGETGRRVFRGWAAQLLGAVLAKLLFAFLLGVVLAVLAILASLEALGWWTQWLLMSAFWWGAYARRHQAVNLAGGASGREAATRPRLLARRPGHALRSSRKLVGAARGAAGKLTRPGRDPQRWEPAVRGGRARARPGVDDQVRRSLESDAREAARHAARLPSIRAQLAAKRAQLARIERARAGALAAADGRYAAELGVRERRVQAEVTEGQVRLASAQPTSRRAPDREQVESRVRFLDSQARLPGSARTSASEGKRREYAALAGLAGYGREEYERLDPRRRRVARMEIDRELALRGQMHPVAEHVAPRAHAVAGRDRQDVFPDHPLEPTSQGRRAGGGAVPSARARESSVMQDAREVAERRKRQLGRGRP